MTMMPAAHLLRRKPIGLVLRGHGTLDIHGPDCRGRIVERRWRERRGDRVRRAKGSARRSHAAEPQCQLEEIPSFHRAPP
jgi:hypothetical protein